MEDWKRVKIVEDTSGSGVFHLILNRPAKRNALDAQFYTEFPRALAALDDNPSVRVIILTGSGNHFCSGIDFSVLGSQLSSQILDNNNNSDDGADDQGRLREKLRRSIKYMQAAITALEQCRKPVIAAIHGGCIGAGVDIITACDIRYCSQDAFFSVKEVDLAITADLGTLQRLPKLVGQGNTMELALTGRRFDANEAKILGLVQNVFNSRQAMEEQVGGIAADIAAKSPLSVVGTKAVLLRSRDMSVSQGLDYVSTWNAAMLLSNDLKEALSAQLEKRKPTFSKL
uniref:TSA: Wollemia nobilis Ref_Wollemi_Transcript_25517_1405 transcribed RNA sequence n=1 Tax=Wollemia nobilis TaxID=56998 RepID=A0A0C9S4A5_9CONI